MARPKFAVAAIRRAAEDERNTSGAATYPGIAERLQAKTADVRWFISRLPWLLEELSITTQKHGGGLSKLSITQKRESAHAQTCARYFQAVCQLRESGELCTSRNIARLSGVKHHAVNIFLDRYPEYIPEWGVISEFEASTIRRKAAIEDAYNSLCERRVPVTKTALARESGIEHSTLWRFLKKHRDFAATLEITNGLQGPRKRGRVPV